MSSISVHHSDCVKWLNEYSGPLFDACVTDPPYHLTSIVKRFGGKNAAEAKVGATGAYARAGKGFMGKAWDGGDVAFRPETWAAVYDRLKPGAHLIAFSGTRTYHRMACAIEDAGFEVRDMLCWHYGRGFPKSHDVSKGIDKAAGHWRGRAGAAHDGDIKRAFGQHYECSEKGDPVTPEAEQWQGWGTSLKPATEPICLARKPLSEKSVAANVLAHGTGALNIDGCRVGTERPGGRPGRVPDSWREREGRADVGLIIQRDERTDIGRWPANLLHDNSDEVLAGFPETSSGQMAAGTVRANRSGFMGNMPGMTAANTPGDSGSAARFFYSAKAGPLDRIGSAHATVKPVDLMRWLVRLVTPTGGHVLDPFAGSGTTGIACMAERFDCTMIEMEADHVADIERKLAFLRGEGKTAIEEHLHARLQRPRQARDDGGLPGLWA